MGILGRFVRKWIVGRLLLRNPIVFAVVWIVSRLHRGRRLARKVPLATLYGGDRIGADFLDRRGVRDPTAPVPDGVVTTLDGFARGTTAAVGDGSGAGGSGDGNGAAVSDEGSGDGGPAPEPFDPEAVHPSVRGCCERTSTYRTVRRVRWRLGLRLVGRLVSRIGRRAGQLTMPSHGAGWRRIHGRLVAVGTNERETDPREDVRGWIRTDDAGDVASLGLYGTHVAEGDDGPGTSDRGTNVAGGERLLNAAFPLPGCTLSVVARPRHADDRPSGRFKRVRGALGRVGICRGSDDAENGTGIEWTTGGDGHPGVYLRLPAIALKLPVSARLRLLPSGAGDEVAGAAEVRLYGLRLVRIDHRAVPE